MHASNRGNLLKARLLQVSIDERLGLADVRTDIEGDGGP